ncbi:uncharacterized protein MYCFIDRAFT_170426 [Pseudocercospora fijiensis CIRAD86]|uniref:Uncharacterized protein n=1 Tax=Pseudocercospora fijiensis (strain CIRAD86) TaxID=383855 RepID=N1QC19_PSEFD|nr:uncharacterized protein MYCFIDRAFT_170426 [Pseudocercospora fijiensis CIRAD86]EME88857.1 hypothetical protein MYCFIDRAFT_170426 [Pseudocercospora fijiensis CIRAD86]
MSPSFWKDGAKKVSRCCINVKHRLQTSQSQGSLGPDRTGPDRPSRQPVHSPTSVEYFYHNFCTSTRTSKIPTNHHRLHPHIRKNGTVPLTPSNPAALQMMYSSKNDNFRGIR